MTEPGPATPQRTMIWTFARGSERLEVRREVLADGAWLVVTGAHPSAGSTTFKSVVALIQQQGRLEATLLDSGWSLASFEPERRAQGDRRSKARESPDRRRGWTEPAVRNEPS
jgi:hypothetical protein